MRFAAAAPGAARIGVIGVAALWMLALAAYTVGLVAGGQASTGVVLLAVAGALGVPAALLLGLHLASELTLLRREVAALHGGGPQADAVAERAAEAVAARLSRRFTALEGALGDTRAGVAALGVVAGLAPDRGAKRTAEPRPAAADAPALPFAPDDAGGAIAWADVVRALDFPRNEDDAEGFAAMRAALRDAEIAELLQAAEDVLAILAAHGLHMEDLRPDPAALPAWRAYAAGERGPHTAQVGGVRDPGALEKARAMLRADAVFRDAALVLARRWNRLAARLFRELGDDPTILQAADTRTGRAFMLLARAMGAFGD